MSGPPFDFPYLCAHIQINTAEELWKAIRAVNGKYRRSHLVKKEVSAARSALNDSRQPTEVKNYHELVLYSLTRWIGSYYELKSFNEHKDVFQDLMAKSWKSRLILPSSFFLVAEELEALLYCMKQPIDILQNSSVPVVSWQLIIVKKMKNSIAACKCATVIGKQFQQTLIASIEKRMAVLVCAPDEVDFKSYLQFKACELLDPTTCKYWGSVGDEIISAFIEFALELDQKFNLNLALNIPKKRSLSDDNDEYADFYSLALGKPKPQETQATPHQQQPIEVDEVMAVEEPNVTQKSTSKRKKANSNSQTRPNSNNENNDNIPIRVENNVDAGELKKSLESAIRDEFERYRVDVKRGTNAVTCLAWWKKNAHDYSILAKLAAIVLAQPVGTPDVERRCSEAGNIITKLRNRLGHEKTCRLFFIHANGSADWATQNDSLKYLYQSVAEK